MTAQSTSAEAASPTRSDESTREPTAATTHDRTAPSTAEPVGVTMISTPGDGSCGIGTYSRDLLESYDSGESSLLPIEQDRRTVGHFVALAIRALASDGDVIHVQHEYGLFRRTESRYPGIMGMVLFPLLFVGNLLVNKPVIVTMHSVLRPDPDEAPFRVRLFLQISHRIIAAASDHLVFLSEDCEHRFHEDVRRGRPPYSVLPHGVNVGKASDVDRATAKARFGFDSTDDVVAIPGFIRPPKGHDVFVAVARELPDVEFLVAGGARSKGEDFAFARDIEASAPANVTVTGVLADDEFPVALAAADLALLPYRVVTQSGTFNWCAAQELPILASDESYFQRIAAEWDALETTPIEEPAVIADRVRDLLDDQARLETLSRNVRRYKVRNSFEHVADAHYRIYRSIVVDDARQAGRDPVEEPSEPGAPMRAACAAQREATAMSD